ncbi:polysaccharide deacetylase family protein [Dubosiella newyorkensis]|jgi:peptidoglycan/xylan/chitin deacetylase (PgdA/CDA1 family)|uniref:polysaccharide deacetylase family protein n=2 Tax=Dubosiella newyorkensis TaxID=1862672 RepID=UPI0023520B90|nr:polysaccharide deacetylase family protein [Dubosiella newyorkensis]MCI9040751.1 polysaccharide deacetylase family protein [Dubosiella newyorkensis]
MAKRKRRRFHLGRLLAVLLVPLVLIAAIYFVYLKLNPLQLKARDIVVEYKEKFDPKDNIKRVFGGSKDDVKIEGTIDTNAKGEYPITYTYGNEKINAIVNVKDQKPPVLTLQEAKVDMKDKGDPKLIIKEVKDASEVTFDFKYDKKTFDERGKHKIEVTATDEDGNTTTETGTLIREEDSKAPTLVDPDQKITIKQGQELDLSAIKVKDDFDPEPTVTMDEEFDSEEAGKQTIMIKVSDRSGNEKEYEQIVNVKEDPAYGKKVVYLTFDDGPSENTAKILDILDKYNAKATFFVTGNHPEYNKYMKRAAKEGHTIGLHTYTHNYSQLYSSEEAYFDDLQQISDMVEDVTGKKSKVIRFPGGSSNMISANYVDGLMTTLTQKVQEQGYQYFDWNVDSTDASGNGVPVSQLVENATASDDQYINILMHDTDAKDTTVEALPEIIKYYKDKGYVFLGLDTDSYAPHHNVVN